MYKILNNQIIVKTYFIVETKHRLMYTCFVVGTKHKLMYTSLKIELIKKKSLNSL